MNNFKEKFKLYFKKRTQRISISGLSVTYDWYAILFFVTVLTCTGFVMAVFSYRYISNGSVFENADITPSSEISDSKNEEIKEVVEYLKQR